MAGIPPAGVPSEPTPPQESTRSLAQNLKNAAGEFVEQTYQILNSPHLADNPTTLNNYAETINRLHGFANEAGPKK